MGGDNKRGDWAQQPTPEQQAEATRRREIARAAADLAVELTGCVAGSDDHVEVTKRLMRFARLVEAARCPEAASNRMKADDMPASLGQVIEQAMGRIVLGLRPDGRRGE
jgi:hypothetical protein